MEGHAPETGRSSYELIQITYLSLGGNERRGTCDQLNLVTSDGGCLGDVSIHQIHSHVQRFVVHFESLLEFDEPIHEHGAIVHRDHTGLFVVVLGDEEWLPPLVVFTNVDGVLGDGVGILHVLLVKVKLWSGVLVQLQFLGVQNIFKGQKSFNLGLFGCDGGEDLLLRTVDSVVVEGLKANDIIKVKTT